MLLHVQLRLSSIDCVMMRCFHRLYAQQCANSQQAMPRRAVSYDAEAARPESFCRPRRLQVCSGIAQMLRLSMLRMYKACNAAKP